MKKTYTKKFILEAIAYWEKQLKMVNESDYIAGKAPSMQKAFKLFTSLDKNSKADQYFVAHLLSAIDKDKLWAYFNDLYDQMTHASRYAATGEWQPELDDLPAVNNGPIELPNTRKCSLKLSEILNIIDPAKYDDFIP